jgi:hypothetical protein
MTYIVPDPVDLRRECLEVATLCKVEVIRSIFVGVNVDNGIEDRNQEFGRKSSRWRSR